MCWLLGGGHLASLSRRSGSAKDINLLWEAPWRTIDSHRHSERTHARIYGPPPTGQFLAGFTGHAICLDYFGAPSEEETRLGLPLHGELASRRWAVTRRSVSRSEVRLGFRAAAPIAGLRFRRDISLRQGESVAYVTETVTNIERRDRFFQWVQHVTLGPPFLAAGESVCAVSGTCARTWALGYEGKSLLASDRDFDWPMAPSEDNGFVDISRPFVRDGRGFVAGVLLRRDSQVGYIAALNWHMGLLMGYCFRIAEFPWVAIWEENRARVGAPWNGTTQARGLEFGTSPMPLGLRDSILAGPLFGTPRVRCLPAGGKQKCAYAVFVTDVSASMREISDIQATGNTIVVTGARATDRIALEATGLREFGLN